MTGFGWGECDGFPRPPFPQKQLSIGELFAARLLNNRRDGRSQAKNSCRSPVCAPSGVAQATFLRLLGSFQSGKLRLALHVVSSPLRRAASSMANDTTPAS